MGIDTLITANVYGIVNLNKYSLANGTTNKNEEHLSFDSKLSV